MARFAVIDAEGIVKNVILWDEVSQWDPPEGHALIKAEDVFCDIGWKHENGIFTNPNPPAEPTPEPTSAPTGG